MSLAGYAQLAADNVFHICGEAKDRGGASVRRPFDGSQQKHLSFIAVIHNRSSSQTYGLWPANRASRKSRRKLPLDLRRLARIPGVLPIDVPAWIQPKQQSDPQRFARRRILFGDQLDPGVRICRQLRAQTSGEDQHPARYQERPFLPEQENHVALTDRRAFGSRLYQLGAVEIGVGEAVASDNFARPQKYWGMEHGACIHAGVLAQFTCWADPSDSTTLRPRLETKRRCQHIDSPGPAPGRSRLADTFAPHLTAPDSWRSRTDTAFWPSRA